jgi:hypothetical protein
MRMIGVYFFFLCQFSKERIKVKLPATASMLAKGGAPAVANPTKLGWINTAPQTMSKIPTLAAKMCTLT